MRRRTALGLLGATTGALLLGKYTFLPPGPSRSLGSVRDLASRLHDSLEGPARERVCLPYDHPLRQYHNRGVGGGGMDVDRATFSRAQRSLLTDLLYAGLSPEGRERIPGQFFISWPGVHSMDVALFGDPRQEHFQVVLCGPHLNLRLGGASREGVAFGGPQVYGDQRGNHRPGLPGNVYRYQYEAAHRILEGLPREVHDAAFIRKAPIQTQIEVQGPGGRFPGVGVETLPAPARKEIRKLVDGILSTYHPEDAAYARRCIEENGGAGALHLSHYREGDEPGESRHQIFRLEGPAAVFHFRGFPHVHAFINVAMDGSRPLSVGEVLGENPSWLEGEAVRLLFHEAMREQTGADLAFYGPESVVGRLRPGTVRTGDIYVLESWQDRIALVEVKGSAMGGALLDDLRRRETSIAPARTYTVAVAGYVGDEPARRSVGEAAAVSRGPLLREAVIAHLKARGFPGGAGPAA